MRTTGARTLISYQCRKYVLQKVRKNKPDNVRGRLAIESRLEFINQEVIDEVKNILGDSFDISFEYGMESTSPVIRETCINKRLPHDWLDKIKLMKSNNIIINADILIKPPFLTNLESIDDVKKSVNETLENQYADHIIVMVMGIYPNTVVGALYKAGNYQLPSIWMIIETIRAINPEQWKHLMLGGFARYKVQTKALSSSLFVRGCKECSPKLMPHFFNFNRPDHSTIEMILDVADKLNCKCKKKFYQECEAEDSLYSNLNQRILDGMDNLSITYLNKNLSQILNEKIKND